MTVRSFRLVSAVSLAVLVLVLSAVPAMAAKTFAVVELTYDPDTKTCGASPDPVQVFWFKKPKKVKWVSEDASLYWEVEWKGGEGKKDYFGGDFDIKCGKTEKKSTLPGGRDKDNASWAYTIRVFPCQGGQRTGEMLCEVDPVVDWEP